MKNSKIRYVGYVLFFIIVTTIIFPILLLHTSFFKNARKVYVSSAMSTTTHQWLATKFLSYDKINDIITKDNKKLSSDKRNSNTVSLPKENDDAIDFFKISNTRYKGYGLVIHNPRRVKVAASEDGGETGEHIEKIVSKNKAVCGINGGGFIPIFETNKNKPLGIIMTNGKLIYPKSEEEVDLREKYIGAINEDGLLMVGNYTMENLRKLNIKEAISFGPVLVKDGIIMDIIGSSAWGPSEGISQRSLIGQKQDGSIILVVIEGILNVRAGASLNEARQLMLDLGCVNAINLDGGNSVIMYKSGQVINREPGSSSSRNLSSAIIVK